MASPSSSVSVSESVPSPSVDHRSSIPVLSLPPPDPLYDTPHNTIFFLGFNQDYGRFACGTSFGFRVYDCDSVKEVFSRESSDGGGIGMVELLFRSNIVALVGGGPNPKYPPNKVMIWDDHQMQCIGELSFRSQVLSVKLRRDRIVVVLECKIYVYNFADLKLLLQIETIANPKGLCAISSTTNPFIIACPGITKGQIHIELPGGKYPKYISAHDSSISCLALTFDGHLLATASSKGTLIRIFNSLDGTKLQEVRRGVDKAQIFSISFSANAHWLAISSDKGTVHVFNIKASAKDEGNKSTGYDSDGHNAVAVSSAVSKVNPGSTFSFMKGVLPKYFSSEWSFCQYRLPEEVKSIVAFGPEKHTIVVVGSDGSFSRCAFDPVNGGEMVEHERGKYFQP